jgi:hypothetical protein
MDVVFKVFLLMFGAIGFTGTGIGLGVARSRYEADGDVDSGMIGVSGLLFVFGSVCTIIGTGLAGVPAFGGVIAWSAYIISAQRLGVFAIETGSLEGTVADQPRQRT